MDWVNFAHMVTVMMQHAGMSTALKTAEPAVVATPPIGKAIHVSVDEHEDQGGEQLGRLEPTALMVAPFTPSRMLRPR